jgi:hypothetical protein
MTCFPARRVSMLLALSCALLAPTLFAGEAHPKGAHLRYVTDYDDALLEARVRNVPIFFSRHKDF